MGQDGMKMSAKEMYKVLDNMIMEYINSPSLKINEMIVHHEWDGLQALQTIRSMLLEYSLTHE